MAEKIENIEQEVKEQTESPNKMFEVSIKFFEDGSIKWEVLSDNDAPTNLLAVENIIKQTYDSMRDQRVIDMALDAFKQKLSI